jgi:hypothetical protein
MMAKKLIFRIKSNGDLFGLWHDMLSMSIGDVHVRRASDVEYDEIRGGWIVNLRLNDAKDSPVFPKREDALAWEVKVLNNMIREGSIPCQLQNV